MSADGPITAETRISDAIRICPAAPEIFREMGMGCCACMAASAETIGEGAEMHEVDADVIVARLNEACK